MKELKDILINLLTTKCVYKYDNRSGWVCGMGNGIIVYIEDHRNNLSIKSIECCNYWCLISKNIISSLLGVNNEIYVISDTNEYFTHPDSHILELSKQYAKSNLREVSEITESDIDEAIEYCNIK